MSLTHVKGLSGINKLFDRIGDPKVIGNIVRGGARVGAKVLQQEIKANIPADTGTLRDGIKISTRKKGSVISASIKASGKHAYLAPFLEFGTRPHKIPGPLALSGGVVAGVEHPGIRPRPTFRPALDAKATEAVIAMGNYMKNRLATKHGLDTSDIVIGEDE